MRILVTGGCGYIGSHTIVDLIEQGYDVVSIDNFVNSNSDSLQGIKAITGKPITNYNVDLCDFEATLKVVKGQKFDGIIHFAALKSAPDSVANPALYYHNNINSLLTALRIAEQLNIPNFVFSSSCSVYGNSKDLPVTEESLLQPSESPYGATKQMGEHIIKDLCRNVNIKFILLRYFNPVGAHPSAQLGELPAAMPQNLIPAITQTAAGLLPSMHVWGVDYDTRDGSCVRDFVHVCDIAQAHTLALKHLIAGKQAKAYDIFNLGTGNGVTVLEAIKSFERVSGVKLNYQLGPRREGDVIEVYANSSKAQDILGWHCKYGLDQMMDTAWAWQQKIMEPSMQLH